MWPWNSATAGHVYILHLSRPLGNLANRRAQALHYCGFAEDLEARLAKHRAGRGSKLIAAAVAQNISFEVFAWPASLAVEKRVKAYKKTSAFCPACARSAGGIARALPVAPAVAYVQLELELEALPDVPIRRMDWLEMQIERSWRAARIRPAAFGLEDDLL
jgi:predicted GIY-YIG superfamily endonuclease